MLIFLGEVGHMPLFNHQFDKYALLQCITQRTIDDLLNPRALLYSTCDEIETNAWLKIACMAGKKIAIQSCNI